MHGEFWWLFHHWHWYARGWHWAWLTPIAVAWFGAAVWLRGRRDERADSRRRMFPGGDPRQIIPCPSWCKIKVEHEHRQVKDGHTWSDRPIA